MHLRTSEFAANVKLLTCMLRRTVACFVWPWASADLSSVSCSTCKTLSEYCGLSKPKSYALQALAALCWASNKAASEESTPGIAISVLYNLVDCTPVRFVIYCVTNMRRTAETVLAILAASEMHVHKSREHNMSKSPWNVELHVAPYGASSLYVVVTRLSRTVSLDEPIADPYKPDSLE